MIKAFIYISQKKNIYLSTHVLHNIYKSERDEKHVELMSSVREHVSGNSLPTLHFHVVKHGSCTSQTVHLCKYGERATCYDSLHGR